MELFPADITMLDLLRQRPGMSVNELASAMEVTATAVRQRLTRLMASGYVNRQTVKSGRGRPSYQYHLTSSGRRKAGANFADLAIVLWEEIRQIDDMEVRRGLIQRISARLAKVYESDLEGGTPRERLASLAKLFAEKNVPLVVEDGQLLPVITALACPYPDLAERDRSICAMERQMFSDLAGETLRLTHCRLDGDECCTFAPSASAVGRRREETPRRGADDRTET